LYCLTGQVKGAADYISAESRKARRFEQLTEGDDRLHREG
jgi:hypothetical protein